MDTKCPHRYGVELEFASRATPNQIVALYAGNDLALCFRDGNSDGRAWELKPDESVVTPKMVAEGWKGYELVSPVLCGYDELKRYMDLMPLLCADITDSAGLHVHLDISEYEWHDLASLVDLVRTNEDKLYDLLPAHRRFNGYCRSVKDDPTYREIATAASEATVMSAVQRLVENRLEDRYFGLNLTDYTRRKTVEFRYGAGTVGIRNAVRWIEVLQGMADAATRPDSKPTLETKGD